MGKIRESKGKNKEVETEHPRKTIDYVEPGKPRTVPRRRGDRPISRESSVESLSSDLNTLYRGLRPDEDYKKGLSSKNKNSSITPVGHVSRTLENTPYVSLSRSLKPAAHFAVSEKEKERRPGTMIEVDKKKLIGKNFDLTEEDVFNEQGINRNPFAARNVLKAQEVLHKGDIPKESIKAVIKVKPGISQDERRKIKGLNDPNYFTKQFFYNHTDEKSEKKGYPPGYSFRRTPLKHESRMPEEGLEATSITTPWFGNSSITTSANKKNLGSSSTPLYKEGKLNDFGKGGKVSQPKKSNRKSTASNREQLESMLRGK